jgi:hypothetical protein
MNESNGEIFTPFLSVGEALDTSINADGPDGVLEVVTSVLDEAEALLILAKHAEDYERTDNACALLAGQLSENLGYDRALTHDVLRELSKLALRQKYTIHMRRLSASRKQITLWKKATIAWATAAEQHAEDQLGTALAEAGFIPE